MLRLLHKLLEVNPYFRPTAKECLADPIFNDIRNEEMEAEAPCFIQQSVYMPGVFDYEENEHTKFAIKDYKTIL